MQRIQKLNDLTPYGIIPVTGDACSLMYPVLFDVTPQGLAILQKCFGVKTLELHTPDSSGTNQRPHVGSIMLAPEMLPAVGLFCLLESGCSEVWRKGDSLYGIESDDSQEYLKSFKSTHGPLRRLSYGD